MKVDLTPSQVMALMQIVAATLTTPSHTDVHLDVVRQVETTPEELLVILMDANQRADAEPAPVATLTDDDLARSLKTLDARLAALRTEASRRRWERRRW